MIEYPGSLCYDEGGVRFFILKGTEKALMIDCGMATRNALDIAKESVGSLPIELIYTHADMDHTGSHEQFPEFYMHPAECVNYYANGRGGKIKPVYDNDIIDLGDRPLRIIETPGHTPGSIAILDIKYRNIYTGDPVQDGRIFMFGPYRNMQAYLVSIERLMSISDSFDAIYPSHGTAPVKKDILPKLKEAAEKILSGNAVGREEDVFGRKIIAYVMGVATFLCDR